MGVESRNGFWSKKRRELIFKKIIEMGKKMNERIEKFKWEIKIKIREKMKNEGGGRKLKMRRMKGRIGGIMEGGLKREEEMGLDIK